MAILCICGKKAQMVRGSKEDFILYQEDNLSSSILKQNESGEFKNLNEKEKFIFRTTDSFCVRRTYLCTHCKRQFTTLEEKEIPTQIIITGKDDVENFFHPLNYENSLAIALVDEKDGQKIIDKIVNDFLEKCENERLKKEYKYTENELYRFTLYKLKEYASRDAALNYIKNENFKYYEQTITNKLI